VGAIKHCRKVAAERAGSRAQIIENLAWGTRAAGGHRGTLRQETAGQQSLPDLRWANLGLFFTLW
jgi:hypothetical protein